MRNRFVRMAGIAVLVVLVLALVGFVVMQLWNSLLPPLFGLKAIGYWQAVGLLVLTRILFGGLGRRGGHGHWRSRWRKRWQERWEQMSPEEREKFRAGMGARCEDWHSEPKSS